ncbi:MAG: hypothetical protein IJI25_09645 [Eubacterium sp.]|nr:hypothetical protein [Eubacterium sp.]
MTVLKMVAMILDGCKDLDEARTSWLSLWMMRRRKETAVCPIKIGRI